MIEHDANPLIPLVLDAVAVLRRALRVSPPCPHCGRSDVDRNPYAIRAAQLILDRCGLGPSNTAYIKHEDDLSRISLPDLRARLEELEAFERRLIGSNPNGNEPIEGEVVANQVVTKNTVEQTDNAGEGNT